MYDCAVPTAAGVSIQSRYHRLKTTHIPFFKKETILYGRVMLVPHDFNLLLDSLLRVCAG